MSIPIHKAACIRHVEIKAYMDDVALLRDRIAGLCSSKPIMRIQHDTFFHCGTGRLKLRSSGNFSQLIYYRREDDYGPVESVYQKTRAQNPASLHRSLSSALGVVGKVRKLRYVYKLGNVQINVDRVNGLGNFIEVKQRLQQGDSVDSAVRQVRSFMDVLEIDLFQLVDGAYVDLINERASVAELL